MSKFFSLVTVLALAGTASAQPDPQPTPEPGPATPPAEPPVPVVAPVPPEKVPEPPPKVEPKKEDKSKHAAKVGYDDGKGQGKGFFIATDDEKFSIRFGGRVQPFFNLTRTADVYASNLEIRRGRLTLEGNLHGKELTYKFQSDFGKGNLTLKDFLFDLELAKDVYLRFGQWKRPFSRQQITSSGRQELTDRAITDKAFGAGRDIGIALRNDYEKSVPFEWTVGVFNGTGDAAKLEGITAVVDPATGAVTIDSSKAKFNNVPKEFRPALVARVGHNHGTIRGYSEADLEGGPTRWGIGLSIQAEGDLDEDDKSNQKLEADYVIKSSGLSTTGGFYAQTAQDGPRVRDVGKSLVGFHLQAGYMLDKHWQIGGRYALVNDAGQGSTVATDQQEITIGTSYYGYGHDAKFQGAVRLFKNGDAGFTDFILVELGCNVGW